LNGIAASHAPNHPQEWGLEKDGFDFWEDIEQNFSSKSTKRNGEKVSLPANVI
jgi:hypothetical protein